MLTRNVNKLRFIGNIGEYSNNAQQFINEFDSAKSAGNEVLVDLHCYGGQVFEGAAIFNTIDQSDKDVIITVIGIAASYGALMLLPAKTVKACENSMIMLHAPSTMAEGTSQEIKVAYDLLTKLEGQYLQLLVKKTGKTEVEMKKYMDGKDYWLTAHEAKELGIVDEIIPAIAKDINAITITDSLNQESAYNRYVASLDKSFKITPKIEIKNMDKLQIINKYSLKGVDANSTDDQVMAALDAHLESVRNASAQEAEAAIKSVVNQAVVAGKITADKVDRYVAIGKKNGIAELNSILEDINPRQSITNQIHDNGGVVDQDRKNWTWDMYQEKDPQALQAMEKNNPTMLKSLYKAKYGSELIIK